MRISYTLACFGAALLAACAVEPQPNVAADPLAGVYYPPPAVSETYKAKTERMADESRERRINFITFVITTLEERPFPSPYIYAVGEEAAHLVVTSRTGDTFGTVYQARAELELMASIARSTPIYSDLHLSADHYNFLDLANILGFRSVTISNGQDHSYRIEIVQ